MNIFKVNRLEKNNIKNWKSKKKQNSKQKSTRKDGERWTHRCSIFMAYNAIAESSIKEKVRKIRKIRKI